MRRRRFTLLLRAIAMVPLPFSGMCGHQERKAEPVQAAPPAAAEAKAARPAGQPIDRIAVKASRNPKSKGQVESEISGRHRVASPLSATAK